MLQWLRRRQQAEQLAQADAEALIRDHGGAAYGEARQREDDVVRPDGTTHAGRTPAHWRRVALIVATFSLVLKGQIRPSPRPASHAPVSLPIEPHGGIQTLDKRRRPRRDSRKGSILWSMI